MMVRIIAIIGLLATAVLILVINTTAPVTAGPLGILAVFFCIYIILVSCITLTLWGGSHMIARIAKPVVIKRPIHPMRLSRSYYFSSVIALAPVMIIGMQSVGGVNLYEIILVGLFITLGLVYTAKRTA